MRYGLGRSLSRGRANFSKHFQRSNNLLCWSTRTWSFQRWQLSNQHLSRRPNLGLGLLVISRYSYYRKRGSASYIVREVLLVRERERERDTEIQREREIDGSDVTIVALKLAMNLHFPLPKIRTIGDELTLTLAKIFALFVSPFTLPVSPFTERSPWWRWKWVHTFHCQKFFRPQALFPLFQMARAARRVIENPREMIKSCPVLFCSSHRNTESN